MTVLRIAGVMAGVIGLYFLLAGEISVAELLAVVPVLALAILYEVALVRSQSVPLRIGARGYLLLLRSIGGVLPELWRVGGALSRVIARRVPAPQGGVRHVPFRFGALTAEDIGRRAAVVTAISLTPNGIAVGMDHSADELIVHQLLPQPIDGNREWPG